MRDKKSEQVKRSLDPYGVYKKIADRGYKVRPENGQKFELGNSDVEPGFPDGFFIGTYGGCFIETKNGDVTAFAFDNWRPNQRQWYYDVAVPKRIPYWLWLMMGGYVNAKKNPKIALLIPAPRFLEIEAAILPTRKSLSYNTAAGLHFYRLEWAGKDTWNIPSQHPFAIQFELEAVYGRLAG